MGRLYIELTGALFHLKPGAMEAVAAAAPGFAHVFTDHDQDWNFGLADIQGPVKFAESLVRRDLRERRELSEGDRLWLYRVRKQGDRFQAVYGVFSGERYETLHRRYFEHPGGMAVFDGVSVALSLLKRARTGKPKAVIVQAADAAVVAMGDNRHCHWLVRMGALDDSLDSTLERIQAEAAWRKITLSGVDVVRALSGSNAQALPAGIRQWPAKGYALNGRRINSDLEALLPGLALEYCPVTRQEAMHRPLERAEPLVWLGLAAVGLAFLFYGAWLHGATQTLRAQAATLQAEAASYHVAEPKSSAAWQELSQVKDRMGAVLGRPLAGEALLRLSRGVGSLGRIESIGVTEHARGLQLNVQGGIDAGLDAGPIFQKILLGLAEQNFTVLNRQLQVGARGAVFSVGVMLEKTIHAGKGG